jgi:hypothetical protein
MAAHADQQLPRIDTQSVGKLDDRCQSRLSFRALKKTDLRSV